MVTTTSTWLDPIPGLWRDEEAHRYWLGDHLFPVSITGVLAHGLSETAKRAIEAKRPIWEPRGTTVHAALEHYSQARFLVGKSASEALLDAEAMPGHHQYRDWILPLLQLPLWDDVEVIASERLTCCLTRNVAGAFDGAYVSPALSERPRPALFHRRPAGRLHGARGRAGDPLRAGPDDLEQARRGVHQHLLQP